MESTGRVFQLESGEWRQQPDYVKAVQLYRRVLTEFKKGETRYFDQAQQQLNNITNPVVGVYSSTVFLPDSEVQVNLSWRNVKNIEFKLYRVDLPTDVRFTHSDTSAWSWVTQINVAANAPLKTWSRATNDDGTHKPGQDFLRLDGRLATGAYVIEANAGSANARDLILVTDAALVLKTTGKQALVYFCDALSGAPVPNAAV